MAPVDDEPSGGADEGAPAATPEPAGLPWSEDLPVALGDEPGTGVDGTEDLPDSGDEFDYGDDLGDLTDDPYGGRRNALPPRLESWRTRSATGAIATAMAMGLKQVFQPEKRRPAIMAEAPGDPYTDDDPVTVDYAPDDAPGTTVHVKPWLLDKGGDPT